MVAIRLLMFSAGIDGGGSKFVRLAGVSVDLLVVHGPGAPFRPVGGESAEVLSPAEVPPWAEVWDDDTEEPVSELLPAFFLLLRLRLRPLLDILLCDQVSQCSYKMIRGMKFTCLWPLLSPFPPSLQLQESPPPFNQL